ncbi:hypothetical protein FNO01nite_33420 [Flavobacterium noncentrifugens]|uniref:Por secretion system C-terminal sorting domain-containing protein n=1 Tax=Flavobacterium noncentrifugens TaxID=1128970 RepID=A0A1G8Y5E9_9FLAO|nr:T9SS type A sorting domain-containing protein [Flavobacterium noncentrifugens]GEP52670.1 hypothetical protein FNO01nite_33420 [Flavobacterium noncentrifugens]SDJ98058.1 Por secretion system C-terminal sorting domain-containing protein [Flavobacterium noncentrifugens]
MKKHLLYLLLLGAGLANAQVAPRIEWSKTLGSSEGDEGFGIANTPDGGYIAIGNTYKVDGDVTANNGIYDYWVAKLNHAGAIEWTKNYGGTNSDEARKIVPTPDGGYILGGMTDSNNMDVSGTHGDWWFEDVWYGDYQNDYWIVKIDSVGTIQWQKTLGGNYRELLTDIKLTSTGGYIISGTSNSSSGDVTDSHQADGGIDSDAWVVNLDAAGNILWQRAYGGYDGSSSFSSIEQTSDGGYVAAGSTSAVGGDAPPLKGIADLWVVKTGATGDIVWSKTFGGSRGQDAQSVKQLPGNGYIVCGVTSSADGDVTNGVDNLNTRWIIKLDDEGNLEWNRTYPDMRGFMAAEVTADGNLVVGSMFPQDKHLMKIDVATGDIIWSKTYGGSQRDMIFGMALTPEGGFITVGGTNSNDGDVVGNHGDYDIWVVKLSPDCLVPELTIDTTHRICAQSSVNLTADVTAATVNWYDSAMAEAPVFTGTNFETPDLTATTSYWVEAVSGFCKTARTEIVITVNPLPVLTIDETAVAICSGNEASLHATSPGNVIFWYANANDMEYLYHGNLFVTDALMANTTYWVQAYNLLTGCTSERTAVAIAVGEPLSAPTANATQNPGSGMTLTNLIVAHTGTLTWYANESLTTELPETTVAVNGTTYYVTQSAAGCMSAATAILIDTSLSTVQISADHFAYYPNPVTTVLHFKGNDTLKSVQVYDLLGKLIFNQQSNAIQEVNLSALQQGTYILKATTDKGINTFKIIKD